MPHSPTGNETDEYSEGEFAGLTEEDYAQLDAAASLKKKMKKPTRADTEEFSDGGFGSLTEADLAVLDAAAGSSSTTKVSHAAGPSSIPKCSPVAAPAIEIQYDGWDVLKAIPEPKQSPLQTFRQRRNKMGLSVTDLVGPVWCEVQFEYKLYGQRYKKLEQRPASFVSRGGKTMFGDKGIAQSGDIILKSGTAVHKKLERELKPIEVKVSVRTQEDRWGLRLVNMLEGVASLQARNQTREMPVFGIVQDMLIYGVIDEVVKLKIPEKQPPHSRKTSKRPRSPKTSPTKPKRRKSSSSDVTFIDLDQLEDSDSETSTSAPPSAPTTAPRDTLRLIDTKTRTTTYLPSEDDSFAARLQLMIYHRLLWPLVNSKDPFNFEGVWEKLNIDPAVTFSKKFIETSATVLGEQVEFTCLNDLTRIWGENVASLNIPFMDDGLQITYRSRKDPSKKPQLEFAETMAGGVDEAVAQQLSILDEKQTELIKSIAGDSPGGDEVVARQLSLLDYWNKTLNPKTSHSAEEPLRLPRPEPVGIQEDPIPANSKIIGKTRFKLDNSLLDSHLVSVLKWWKGQREAEGVSEEHARRCNTCEFLEECEWRSKKHMELNQGLNAPSGSKPAGFGKSAGFGESFV